MKNYLIGASLVALLAVPALAIQAGGDHHGAKGPRGPETRAEAQAEAQKHFAMVDTNKDGAVTQAEADAARAAMKGQWQKKRGERRAEMFGKLDTDKNGQLSPAEFNAPRPDRGKGDGEHRGHMRGHRGGMMGGGMMGGDMFARLDANKDGKVTLAEASAKRLEMFDKADANKDGTVTPEERKAAWQAMRAEWQKKPS